MKNLQDATVCILGGGQLGKMSAMAAQRMGIETMVWAPDGDNPAMAVATHRLIAPFDNHTTLDEVVCAATVVTTEWENVPLELVRKLEQRGKTVRPDSLALETAQSRWAEKKLAQYLEIPTALTVKLPRNNADLSQCLPGIVKTDGGGYDGKGQWNVSSPEEVATTLQETGQDCILERKVKIKTECSVLVARTAEGFLSVSDVVENKHKNGILVQSRWPTSLNHEQEQIAQRYAQIIAEVLELEGILVAEFIVDQRDQILFNEIAPRPHNSFHGSIEAARTSQFEQHIRAILGLPLGSVEFHTQFLMHNLLGGDWSDWRKHLADPNASLHIYGKAESRPGRKMGHVTILDRQ